MKRSFAIGLVLGLLALGSTAGFPKPISRVLGVEAGYGVLTQGSSALLSSFYYGYLVGDKPNSQTLLSLALGYTWFPDAVSGADLHSIVYGLEYAHTFFASKPVSLVLDYGLLFNMIFQSGRKGYAFAHHTRLGAGPSFSLGPRDRLLLNVGYEFVIYPYFELASARVSYPSVSLRWMHRF